MNGIMGMLLNGSWQVKQSWANDDGKFERQESAFRHSVCREEGSKHPVAANRYHLYVSYACPWAHRVLIARALKGLEHAIDVTVVDPFMGEDGWAFSERMGCSPDPIRGAAYLRELYVAADPNFTGRVTVPTLWDKQLGTIVNNESRELLAMLDREFAPIGTEQLSLWPVERDDEIGAMIDANYQPINNGVYRAGFATKQDAYEEALGELFERLDACERILARQPFLCGAHATAADICLFTTLLRFDPVYHYHFKCNVRRLRDYPNLWEFTRALYQVPEIQATCRLDHIKLHYYGSHGNINPTRIVPAGPEMDFVAAVGDARKTPFRRS